MIARHSWLSLLTLAALLLGPLAVSPRASQAQTFDQTFTVDTLSDIAVPVSGDYCLSAVLNDCSLRRALFKASTLTATQSKLINFANLTGTISITNTAGLLPPLGSNTTLQGRTSFITGRPLIEIVGSGSNRSAGIRINGNNNTVSDLVLYGFNDAITDSNGGSAIVVSGDSNRIIRNYIGVKTDKTTPSPNIRGIRINPGADGNTIGQSGGPNIIGGNQGVGVEIIDAGSNIIAGNFIGLFPSDLEPETIGNGLYGIQITSNGGSAISNRIGGTADEFEANLIGGNEQSGIRIAGSGVLSTTIAGNFIGAYDATVDLGNSGDGIQIVNGAKDTIIGGSASVPLLVSDNVGYGIFIRDVGTTGTTISGRTLIGLNFAEDASSGNGQDGIFIGNGASNTTITGSAVRIGGNAGVGIRATDLGTSNLQISNTLIGVGPNPNVSNATIQLSNDAGGVLITDGVQNVNLTGNWISGNGTENAFGVRLSQAANTTLQNNYIGLNIARTGTVPNGGPGIDVQNSVNTLIGGPNGDGEGNYIAGNAVAGVRLAGSDTFSTTIDSNYIGVSLNTAISQYSNDAGNTGPGVLVENGPRRTTIGGLGNRIAGNDGPGVQLSATLPNTVTLVSLLENTIGYVPNGGQPPIQIPNSDGVVLAGSGVSAVDVLSNTIRFNSTDGLRITDATTVTVAYNADLSNNGSDGVEITGATSVTLQLNTAINSNGGSGVYVAGGANQVAIRENTIRSNASYAILLRDSATERVTMVDNQIAANALPVTLEGTSIYEGTPPDTATPGPNHDIDPPFDIRVNYNGLISGFVYTGTLGFANGDPVITPTSACITCTIAVYQTDSTLPSPDGQPWTRLRFESSDDLFPAADGSFSGQLTSPVPVNGQLLFAATDGFGNTSAFAVFAVTPDLTLTPLEPIDGAQNAVPTETVTYTLLLQNPGTLDLPSVNLFTGGTLPGWDPSITPTGVAIPAGGERVLTVTLTLPLGTDPNAAAGIVDTTVVTANVPGLITETATLRTTVLEEAVLRVQPVFGQGSARPEQRVTYLHRLFNDGNITVTVNLDYLTRDAANSPIWNDSTTISTDTFTLIPGDFRDVALNVVVPSTGQVGAQATTYITATVEGYPNQTRYFSDTTTVALDVQAEMFSDETQNGAADGEVVFYHTVRNLSNGPATYRLNSQTNYDSIVTFESDTPGVTINPLNNTFTLDNVFDPPQRINTMRLKVTVKLDRLLLPGDQEVINIFLTDAGTGNSIGGAAVVDRVNITRGAVAPRLWLPMLFN